MDFRLFPAFFDKPANIGYAELEPNEVIELFLRQHPIVNVPWILISLVAAILPPIFVNLDQISGINFLSSLSNQVLIGLFTVYYLLVLAYVIEQFLGWYFNIYIVTNIHIIDVNFESLLYRNITEINLSDIESVDSKITGVFGSLFDFGDVNIETAAKAQAVLMKSVPRPDFVSDRIEDLRLAGSSGGGP